MRALVIAGLCVAVALATVVAALPPKAHQLDGYTFERYVHDFQKSYGSASERAMRKGEFEKNLATIRAHNAGKSSYRMGVNHLTDRTAAERAGLNGGRAGHMAHVAAELAKKPFVGKHVLKSGDAPLPSSVDYTKAVPAVLTAVKDQGNCGSCWAHASTEEIESMWALATGNLNVLSQQQITACAPNPQQCGGTGGCMGSIAEIAFDWVVTNGGITEEWQYPYTAWNGTTGACAVNQSTLQQFAQLSGYNKLDVNDQYAVMDALATTGPLAVNVDASSWGVYESGVFQGCDYAKNISIDHVVQLVGYGTDAELGLDYWLVRNSWTSLYGEHGYIRVLKESNPSCGWNVNAQDGTACAGQPTTQWTCGMCGILFDTSYPVVNVS